MNEDRQREQEIRAVSRRAGPGSKGASRRNVLELARENSRLAAMVDASEDAMISCATTGLIVSWNGGANRMFGYQAEEIVGRSIDVIVPETLREENHSLLLELARGEERDPFDTILLARDGRKIAISLRAVSYCNAMQEIVGVAIVARPIARSRHGVEVSGIAEDPEQRGRGDVESVNLAEREFFGFMCHEIRTPLNVSTGYLELLLNATGLTSGQLRYAELARAANASLVGMITDMFDLHDLRMRSFALEPSPFSLLSCVEEVMAMVLPAAEAKNLALDCAIYENVPDRVVGDRARLRQVLLKLLNNAVKFTENGSIVLDVRSKIASDGVEFLHLSVTDTGIGIASEKRHGLFQPFSLANTSMTCKNDGFALGLAISKRLVDLMGGEIGIESEVGVGTVAWFTALMPRMIVRPPMQESEIRRAHGDPGNFRVLVVDDIDTNREIAETYLRDCGYQVDCVSSAFEALRSLSACTYDLVLMDIHMPVMDGIAATLEIRAMPAPLREIPIIAMSADHLPKQVRNFLDAGMNDYVGKPIDRAKLENNIALWLSLDAHKVSRN